MSAELDMSNGRANMAYVGAIPWHGMGTLMQPNMSTDEWARAAGLDFEVVRVPSGFMMGDNFQPDGKFTLVRDDTFAPLGNFSDRYKIVQPSDVLNFFRDFILADDQFTMETAGSLYGGKKIWGLARYNGEIDVMGEAHAPYVMLCTSFDGTTATTAQATMIRVVCKNTLQASLFAKDAAKVSIRHNTVWDDRAAQKAHNQLETIAATFPQYKALAERLSLQRMSRQQTEDFFKKLTKYEEPTPGERVNRRSLNIIDAMMKTYEETLKEGTDGGSAYTAFNAVTRYVDHDRSTKIGENENANMARMASSFFGSGAQLKEQAMELLAA